MSIQAILDAIRASGEARVKEIESQGQVQVRGILAEAEEECQRLREIEHAAVVGPAGGERARILHHARLQALRMVGDVREELIDAALNQARGHLASIRADKTYPEVLAGLKQEALAQVKATMKDGDSARLIADSKDKKLLEAGGAKAGAEVPVDYELDCWGGLTATSEDGKVVAINTLEARLKRAAPYLRRDLGARFASQG